MSNNDLILKYYIQIKTVVFNICKNKSLVDDLLQDMLFLVLQKDNKLLNELNNKNQFMYFVIKIIVNNYKSKSSPFFKMYKRRLPENYICEQYG